MKTLTRIVLLVAVIISLCVIVFRPTPFIDLDCKDFGEWKSAQEVYEVSMAEQGADIHVLDGDNDGFACEKLLYL